MVDFIIVETCDVEDNVYMKLNTNGDDFIFSNTLLLYSNLSNHTINLCIFIP